MMRLPIVLFDSIFWHKTINFRRFADEGLMRGGGS